MYMSFPRYWLHHDVHVLPQVLATSRCTCPSPGIGYITMYMSFPRYWLHHDVHVLPHVLVTSRCTCPSPGIGYITMYMSFPRYWLHHDVHVLPQVLATSRCTCPSQVLATSRCTCPSPGIGYITTYMSVVFVVVPFMNRMCILLIPVICVPIWKIVISLIEKPKLWSLLLIQFVVKKVQILFN